MTSLATARRIVLKVGSALVVDGETGEPDRAWLGALTADAARLTRRGQQVLIVSAEGKVEPRPVKTGGMSGGDWIINDGLAGGEQVML